MKDQTVHVDDIECPYCGHLFGGGKATNYDTSCGLVTCPECERDMVVSQSVEYLATPLEEPEGKRICMKP